MRIIRNVFFNNKCLTKSNKTLVDYHKSTVATQNKRVLYELHFLK